MRYLTLIAVAACLGLAPPAANAGEKIAFQGLDGASTRLDVQKRFPAARSDQKDCSDEARPHSMLNSAVSCDAVVVDGYKPGKLSFRLRFQFLQNGDLSTISAIGVTQYGFFVPERIVRDQDIGQQYRALWRQLSQQYGAPVAAADTRGCVAAGPSPNYSDCDEWLDAQGRATLQMTGGQPGGQSSPFFVRLTISYRFADPKLGGKP